MHTIWVVFMVSNAFLAQDELKGFLSKLSVKDGNQDHWGFFLDLSQRCKVKSLIQGAKEGLRKSSEHTTKHVHTS